MHRAGLEPATLRLKAGGSAIELSVRPRRRAWAHVRGMHREGFEPPTDSLEESCSAPLSYRRVSFIRRRFLLGSIVVPSFSDTQFRMHPVGVEPTTPRLRGGGSPG